MLGILIDYVDECLKYTSAKEIEIQRAIPNTLRQTNFVMAGYMLRYGKVRDIYSSKKDMVLVATDRISTFDYKWPIAIPFKGDILTKISVSQFNQVEDIVDNHMICYPDPNVMVVKKCKPLPIEVILRGYIAGSGWRAYIREPFAKKKSKLIKAEKRWEYGNFFECYGIDLDSGLKENQKLDQVYITPTTKGKKDMPLWDHEADQIIADASGNKNLWDEIKQTSLKLFERGQEIAARQGLILADTKYEFGINSAGDLVLIDEIHTQDSSRFWIASEYKERFECGSKQIGLDKEASRQFIIEKLGRNKGIKEKDIHKALGYNKKDGSFPDSTTNHIVNTSLRYIATYERLLGKDFKIPEYSKIEDRITSNLKSIGLEIT